MTGDDIRQWREARGLSQRQLAALFGIDHSTISRWESGERTPPPYVYRAFATLGKPKTAKERKTNDPEPR